MRNYEIMFIVNPTIPEEEIDKINAQIEGIVTSGGGKIEKIEKMGKRRLSYEIDRHREGYYVLLSSLPTATSSKSANGDCALWTQSSSTLPCAPMKKPAGWRRFEITGRSALHAAIAVPLRLPRNP